MKKEILAVYIKLFFQNKLYQSIFSVVISLAIGYYAYTKHISAVSNSVQVLKKNIANMDEKKLKHEIEKLENEKKRIDNTYAILQEESKALESELYKDTYSVVVDILKKINENAFNIKQYKLSKNDTEIELDLIGSYINLIRFFDFLETIKADIKIVSYDLALKDNLLHVKMVLKIGLIKI